MKSLFAVLLTMLLLPAIAQPNLVEEQLLGVDPIIDEGVQGGLFPGAVLIIGKDGKVIFRKAYGLRSFLPDREPMTLDTIFDAASLTKVVATTPSVMRLFEQGKLRIDDPVTKYLPEFQAQERHHHSTLDDAFFRHAP